ncbi:MAG TPA: adenylate/guanylate cyclase domain-containing protein [Acidimicrobiales bacterium]|jgi:adenylate cyclase
MTEPEEGPAREALRAVLVGMGADLDEVDRAERDGTLTLLAVEKMMVPEPACFDVADVTERTGLSEELLLRMWRALGYPEPRPDEKAFTETDVEILSKVGDLISLDPQQAALVLQVSRVIGSSIARIASAEIDAISGPTATVENVAAVRSDEVVMRAGALLPVIPRVLEVVWRRHLRAAARARMVQVADQTATRVAVGFADLVGFTALSQQVSELELVNIVNQFEDLVFDVITAGGGRVVKTIGDEVMFSVPSPKAAAEIALALVEGTRASEGLTDVRVGMAFGPVVDREGDQYGPVVNLASRITAIALPGTVVVAPELAEAIADDPAYTRRAMRPRYLKDIGRLRLHALRRSAQIEGEFSERRKALLEATRAAIDPE